MANSNEINLELSDTEHNGITIKQVGAGEYELTTTGNDPYAYTKPISTGYSHKKLSVVAFDTFALEAVRNVQIFFGPPIAESHSVKGGKINSSEGWVPFSMNLADSPNWAKGKRQLRIDFGRKPGITLRIRNLRLRALSKKELERLSSAEKAAAQEKAFGVAIKSYFRKAYKATVADVKIDKTSVSITYDAPEPLILGELRPWQYPQLVTTEEELKWSQWMKPGRHTVSLERVTTDKSLPYDRLFSRWCLFSPGPYDISLASHAVCCTHDSDAALKTIPVPKPKTKKGMQITWRPESMHMLDELGIQHATVNIDISNLLRAPEGKPFIEHTYLGKKFRINKSAVDNLSRVLSYAAKKKFLMGAILLISENPPAELKDALIHPDYLPNGIYSMANVTSPEGVLHYAMAIDFLASYFSTEEHGYLHYWIVHNEVDAAWVWTNCGRRGPDTMMDFYVKSMRIVHNTVRQYNPEGRVMISLTHYWKKRNRHGPADAMYAPRDLLNILADHSRVEGDFNWGLAYHPYPHNLRNPQVWNDPVSWSFDTDIISYKNLEVLAAYMKQPRFLRNGKQRKIYLTEQGFSNPDDSPKNLQIQAAAMAYGMKKVNGIDGIDVHILHRWIDHAREGGLNLGIVQNKPGAICSPGKKKPSFDVYAAIGTPREEEACKFALDIIGIKSWDDIFHKEEIK